ncbi:hypothetical protein HDU97_007207 [Phlyctochytrium planicorne]|nr:hypothetical protein HDU97_007207 [Phlyctochytrium planicorne]
MAAEECQRLQDAFPIDSPFGIDFRTGHTVDEAKGFCCGYKDPDNYVTCDDTLGKIVGLKLQQKDLGSSYPIPAGLWTLTELQQLTLSKNRLTGSLPDAVSSLTKLTSLDISGNLLEGTLPTTITNMALLQKLDLSANKLSGAIPANLLSSRALTFLDLHSNSLNGPVPDTISKAERLEYLDLSDNMLDGSLPAAIEALPQLATLNLARNNIYGPVPEWVGSLRKLMTLDLSTNALSGPIPTQVSDAQALTTLNLNDNQLSGPVPTSIGYLRGLKTLHLHGNRLSGEFPQFLIGMQLKSLSLESNCFTNVPNDLVSREGLSGGSGSPGGASQDNTKVITISVAVSACLLLLVIVIFFMARKLWRRARKRSFNIKRDDLWSNYKSSRFAALMAPPSDGRNSAAQPPVAATTPVQTTFTRNQNNDTYQDRNQWSTWERRNNNNNNWSSLPQDQYSDWNDHNSRNNYNDWNNRNNWSSSRYNNHHDDDYNQYSESMISKPYPDQGDGNRFLTSNTQGPSALPSVNWNDAYYSPSGSRNYGGRDGQGMYNQYDARDTYNRRPYHPDVNLPRKNSGSRNYNNYNYDDKYWRGNHSDYTIGAATTNISAPAATAPEKVSQWRENVKADIPPVVSKYHQQPPTETTTTAPSEATSTAEPPKLGRLPPPPQLSRKSSREAPLTRKPSRDQPLDRNPSREKIPALEKTQREANAQSRKKDLELLQSLKEERLHFFSHRRQESNDPSDVTLTEEVTSDFLTDVTSTPTLTSSVPRKTAAPPKSPRAKESEISRSKYATTHEEPKPRRSTSKSRAAAADEPRISLTRRRASFDSLKNIVLLRPSSPTSPSYGKSFHQDLTPKASRNRSTSRTRAPAIVPTPILQQQQRWSMVSDGQISSVIESYASEPEITVVKRKSSRSPTKKPSRSRSGESQEASKARSRSRSVDKNLVRSRSRSVDKLASKRMEAEVERVFPRSPQYDSPFEVSESETPIKTTKLKSILTSSKPSRSTDDRQSKRVAYAPSTRSNSKRRKMVEDVLESEEMSEDIEWKGRKVDLEKLAKSRVESKAVEIDSKGARGRVVEVEPDYKVIRSNSKKSEYDIASRKPSKEAAGTHTDDIEDTRKRALAMVSRSNSKTRKPVPVQEESDLEVKSYASSRNNDIARKPSKENAVTSWVDPDLGLAKVLTVDEKVARYGDESAKQKVVPKRPAVRPQAMVPPAPIESKTYSSNDFRDIEKKLESLIVHQATTPSVPSKVAKSHQNTSIQLAKVQERVARYEEKQVNASVSAQSSKPYASKESNFIDTYKSTDSGYATTDDSGANAGAGSPLSIRRQQMSKPITNPQPHPQPPSSRQLNIPVPPRPQLQHQTYSNPRIVTALDGTRTPYSSTSSSFANGSWERDKERERERERRRMETARNQRDLEPVPLTVNHRGAEIVGKMRGMEPVGKMRGTEGKRYPPLPPSRLPAPPSSYRASNYNIAGGGKEGMYDDPYDMRFSGSGSDEFQFGSVKGRN